MSGSKHALLYASIVLFLPPFKVLAASLNSPSGTFKISDQGVVGQGAYSISNSLAEIGLKLVIPIRLSTSSKDKATATITSLPPKRVGFPNPSSVSGVPGMSGAISPSSGPTASGLPGATGPAAAGSTPAPSSPSGPVGTNVILTPADNQFIDDMVAIHNELRSVHFSPPVQNNTRMSIEAKEWAQTLAEEKDLIHSPPSLRENQGESLAMGCTTAAEEGITAKEAITKWYDEACCHDFSIHGFRNVSGHFSQLVWKATEEIGVGRAFGTKWGMNCSFIVARYKPKGNIDDEANFKENVERGTFDPVAYNCSAVICKPEEVEQSQGLDKTENKQHSQNEIPSNNEPQRYINLSYKTSQRLGNAQGSRDPHGYMKTPERYSKQLSPSSAEYNAGENQQQYVFNGLHQDEGRPRSLVYRAKIPRVSPIKVL